MSDRTITHLSPASDLAQDLGQPGNRWRNGYFENLSDGAGSVTPAAIADHLAFMSGKGAVTPPLTIHTRLDGNDANDGLTAGTAVRTPLRAVELVNTRHAGIVSHLILNFGPGEFVSDWSPRDIAIGPKRLEIVGAGIDATVFTDRRIWEFTDARLSEHRRLSSFTFRKASNGGGAGIVLDGCPSNRVENIRFDNSLLSGGIGGLSLGYNSPLTLLLGDIKFAGKFTYPLNMSTNAGQTVFMGGTCRFTFEPGTTCATVFRLAYGQKLFVPPASPAYDPVYNGMVPSTGFAYMTWGAEIMFGGAAVKNAWMRDWTYTADASSRIRHREEA